VMVTVTTPVGFDAKATVMKMGSLQTDTGIHENGVIDVTCVLFHTFVDTVRLGMVMHHYQGQGHVGRGTWAETGPHGRGHEGRGM